MQVYLKEVPLLPIKSLSLAVSASKEAFPSVLKWNIILHSEVCNSIVYNLVLYIFHMHTQYRVTHALAGYGQEIVFLFQRTAAVLAYMQ